MDMFDFAGMLFGSTRVTQRRQSVTATGVASSEDGVASVTFDGDVTPAEGADEDSDQTIIDLPTSPDVAEGDEVIVTLVGDGPLKTPVVTANPGSGDRMRALANSAKIVADAAQAVANAVNQHFFADTNGIHVTEATQDEWNESHTGANVLINSIGQLFRDGLNNLLTLTTEDGARALTIWDGLGNAAENARAIIGETITLGKTGDKHILIDSDSIDMCDESGTLWSMTSDSNGAPHITTEKDGYYVGSYVAGDGTEAPRHSQTHGLTGFLQDYGDGASVDISASAQYASALKDAEIILFSPSSGNTVSSDSKIAVLSDRVFLSGASSSSGWLSMADVIKMLTTESANLTRGSGASSWAAGQLKRSGKTVVVTVQDFKLASELASGSNSGTIATIPTWYRPGAVQRVPAALSVNGAYANVWAAIGTSGAIVLANHSGLSIPTTATISLNCTYIID